MKKENKNLLTGGQEKVFQQINTKEGRKRLYRFLYDCYHRQDLYSWGLIGHLPDGILKGYKRIHKFNTGIKMVHVFWYLEKELKINMFSLSGNAPSNGIFPFIEFLVNELYSEKRFLRYLGKRVLRHGGEWPKVKSQTNVIREFLARGFVYESEIDTYNYWHIKSHFGDLVWPEQFKSQQDALPVFEEVGIPCYTRLNKPINYKP